MKATNNEDIFIYGRQPVLDVLRRTPKRVKRLLVKESVQASFLKDIEALARKAHMKIQTVTENDIERLVGEVNHQGVVALIASGAQMFSIWKDTVKLHKNPAILLFQDIQDPHNVGAMIRTAVAVGVEAVLVPRFNQAPLDGAVYKTSAGMVDRIPVVEIGNVNESIRKLKEIGFWIVGIDEEGKQSIWEGDFDMPICFVIGSEGDGMPEKTRELCDFLIQIPMENNVPSLNASVSAAIVMYEWKRRRASNAPVVTSKVVKKTKK